MAQPQLGDNDKAVHALLQKTARPLSAYDILQGLRGGKIRAAVQVYRALTKLEALGLVHRVESLNAFVICSCDHQTSAPGFMLCNCCGDVREFDAARSLKAARQVAADFRIVEPHLELRGLCAHCQVEGHRH